MFSFSLLHSPSIISGEFLDQQSQVDNSCSCRLNLMTQEEIVQRYYGLCYRYHCSRFGYHWSMEDTKTTCSSPKDILMTLRARDDLQLNTLSAREKCRNGYGFIKWFFKPNASSLIKTYGSILSASGSLEGCGMLRRPFSIA